VQETLKLAGVEVRIRSAPEALDQTLIEAELTAVMGAPRRTSAPRPARPAQRTPNEDVDHHAMRLPQEGLH
jgi:hypothetical protein